MKDKRVLIIGLLVTILLIAIPLTVYIANQQQDVRSSAQTADSTISITPTNTPTPTPTNVPTSTPTLTPTLTPTPTSSVATTITPTISPTIISSLTPTLTGGACQTPGVVSGVELNYPSCQGTQCNFSQADCTWAAVNGAVSYTVTVTQVDTGAVTATTSVTAPTVTYAFPVQQGQTYRCDIAAVNSCGTSGQAGSAQAICSVDGQVSSPTAAQPTSPQVIPTVVPTGDTNTTVLVGIGGMIIAIIGGVLFFFSGI